MNSVDLLKEFAKRHNIDNKEVEDFLKLMNEPKTIEELLELPYDMLNHYKYISYVEEPLREFIVGDGDNFEKYETITLEVVNELLRKAYLSLQTDDTELLSELREVHACIVKTKFGSVVYDWWFRWTTLLN